MSADDMVEEFDTVAGWTVEAVAELGPDYAVPAGCRGSGSPAGLDWLAERMGLEKGTRLLDSGAGVGGPAQYVADRFGVIPLLVEPMIGACRAAAGLFGHPVVVGDGAALPVRSGAVDAAWSLGVLCTVADKAAHLAELVRVVGAQGAVGLLVFVRTVPHLEDEPDGNAFPDLRELDAALDQAGLRCDERVWVHDLAPTPADWSEAVAAVERVIERDHGTERGHRSAEKQSRRVGELMGDNLVAGCLLVCRKQIHMTKDVQASRAVGSAADVVAHDPR